MNVSAKHLNVIHRVIVAFLIMGIFYSFVSYFIGNGVRGSLHVLLVTVILGIPALQSTRLSMTSNPRRMSIIGYIAALSGVIAFGAFLLSNFGTHANFLMLLIIDIFGLAALVSGLVALTYSVQSIIKGNKVNAGSLGSLVGLVAVLIIGICLRSVLPLPAPSYEVTGYNDLERSISGTHSIALPDVGIINKWSSGTVYLFDRTDLNQICGYSLSGISSTINVDIRCQDLMKLSSQEISEFHAYESIYSDYIYRGITIVTHSFGENGYVWFICFQHQYVLKCSPGNEDAMALLYLVANSIVDNLEGTQ